MSAGVERLWSDLSNVLQAMGASLAPLERVDVLADPHERADVSAAVSVQSDDPHQVVLAFDHDTALALGRTLSGKPDLAADDPLVADTVAELTNILVGASGHARFSVPTTDSRPSHRLALGADPVERGRARAGDTRLYRAPTRADVA